MFTKIDITYERLRIPAFAFLLLPLVLFLLFFVKKFISIPVSIVVVFSFFYSLLLKKKDKNKSENEVQISISLLVIIAVVCLIWCFLGGHGGFFYQTSDWNVRNAVFRDLIRYSWPVYYSETDTLMSYYVGHWLPAAAVGKVLLKITGSLDVAWIVGNILLGIWTSLGCYISILLLLAYTKPRKCLFIIMIVLLMMIFSGLDVIGWISNGRTLQDIEAYQHIEWWQSGMQFSSNTTCLYWVFNQSTAAWIGTLCVVNDKKVDNYGVIITGCIVSSILPGIGLSAIMLSMIAVRFAQSVMAKTLKTFLRELFSIQNILVLIFAMPILFFYYTINTALGDTPGNTDPVTDKIDNWVFLVGAGVLLIVFLVLLFYSKKNKKPNRFMWVFGLMTILLSFAVNLTIRPDVQDNFFLFILLEAGIYFVLLFSSFYNEPIYYIASCLLVVVPSIRVGMANDFCMRASIPPLIVFMALCGKKMVDDLEKQVKTTAKIVRKITSVLLIIVLLIGMATPVIEVERGFYYWQKYGTPFLVSDDIYTLNRYFDGDKIGTNFVAVNYKESFFYKYLMG